MIFLLFTVFTKQTANARCGPQFNNHKCAKGFCSWNSICRVKGSKNGCKARYSADGTCDYPEKEPCGDWNMGIPLTCNGKRPYCQMVDDKAGSCSRTKKGCEPNYSSKPC
eukprot:NODE_131_length_16689_cov_0.437914.p17 type:complete len:110 gc:universal NODE_131_length_16689_cov_0.437914:4878-5207(+)